MDLSNQGDDKKVDLFVKDIYTGKDTPNLKLDSSSLAISFGKMTDRANLKYTNINTRLLKISMKEI